MPKTSRFYNPYAKQKLHTQYTCHIIQVRRQTLRPGTSPNAISVREALFSYMLRRHGRFVGINPRQCRGVHLPPPRVFLKWPPNRWADRAEILLSLWGILCTTFGEKKLTESGRVTELWRHKRNSLRPTFQGNRVSSYGTCCHSLEWRYYERFRPSDDHTRLLTLHLDLQRSSEVTDPLHTYSG